MIKFLKNLSPTVIVLFALSIISFYWMQQSQKLESKIATLKENFTQERLAIANAHKIELQRRSELNDELTRKLIEKQNQITEQLQQLESAIDDAIKKDGATYNGIGADSLCIYKRAHGYDCK
ncbi:MULTISPECIES: hypothetical protein [unclassified Gilliamella]|uniref:hypothetical protein n=1 Tax=unclassified Gilliamella TaxID=2685620 RepID=UPI0009BE6852|nr:hypothetical protein [Gilliamella apicola]